MRKWRIFVEVSERNTAASVFFSLLKQHLVLIHPCTVRICTTFSQHLLQLLLFCCQHFLKFVDLLVPSFSIAATPFQLRVLLSELRNEHFHLLKLCHQSPLSYSRCHSCFLGLQLHNRCISSKPVRVQ